MPGWLLGSNEGLKDQHWPCLALRDAQAQCCGGQGNSGCLWLAPAASGSLTLALSMPPTQTQTGSHRGGARMGSVDHAGSTFREKESQPPLNGLALEREQGGDREEGSGKGRPCPWRTIRGPKAPGRRGRDRTLPHYSLVLRLHSMLQRGTCPVYYAMRAPGLANNTGFPGILRNPWCDSLTGKHPFSELRDQQDRHTSPGDLRCPRGDSC